MSELKKVELKPDIYWVGGIDWDIRNFHGYSTKRGTTYNAYLILDKKVTLIDTVKHYLFDEMLSRIKEIVNPDEIDYIISNHVEMDHSGSLPKILIKELSLPGTVLSSIGYIYPNFPFLTNQSKLGVSATSKGVFPPKTLAPNPEAPSNITSIFFMKKIGNLNL